MGRLSIPHLALFSFLAHPTKGGAKEPPSTRKNVSNAVACSHPAIPRWGLSMLFTENQDSGVDALPAPEIKYPVFRAARDRFQSWTGQKLRPRSRFSYVVPRSEDIDLK